MPWNDVWLVGHILIRQDPAGVMQVIEDQGSQSKRVDICGQMWGWENWNWKD